MSLSNLGNHMMQQFISLLGQEKTAKSLVENLLPQFFLRRMKTLIKDQLPKKSDRVVFCPLTETQTDAYQRYLDSEIVQAINSAQTCATVAVEKRLVSWDELSDGSKWQAHVFPAISTLQKISNHLARLIPQGNDPSDKQAKDLETLQLCLPDQWEEAYATRDNMLNYANPSFAGSGMCYASYCNSGTMKGGNKILVFSHSVRLLKMLQTLLGASYNVSYLDGSMSYDDRFAVVREFNTDPTQFVFLSVQKLAVLALTLLLLTKSSLLIRIGNPSYDLQAQDRVIESARHAMLKF